MTKLKKLTAVFLSAVLIVCCFAVPSSAVGVFDFAEDLAPMEFAADKVTSSQPEVYYKVVVSSSGTITFHCTDYSSSGWHLNDPRLSLLDANGSLLTPVPPGETVRSFLVMNGRSYRISKGTYYIKIERGIRDGWYNNFYYDFAADVKPTISIGISLKVGSSVDLTSITENYTGKVAWKSTKSSVATVSSGTVQAKKAGTAKIRAYMSNGEYAEITVKVVKK